MSDSGTAVARRGVLGIGELARAQFSVEQVQLIKDTVCPRDATDAEFAMFLELSARYELDPFAKEIFLTKMKGKDGKPGRVAIIVSRDGFLQIANRSGEFEGIEGDVVRERDTFRKKAGSVYPEHEYEGHVLSPLLDENGNQKYPVEFPENARGAIVGAWAVVHRTGRKSTFFYAPWSEYVPSADRKRATPWGKQESAMILKCAETTALRKAFSITGVVGEEEMASAIVQQDAETGLPDFGGDPVMADWLPRLFDAANEIAPDKYRPAKVRVMLGGLDTDGRRALADDVYAFIANAGRIPPEPRSLEEIHEAEQERLREVPEEVVREEDAEVIHDGTPTA